MLYWEESIKLNVLSYGQHHIDTLIWDGNHHASWRATFVYGEPCVTDRHVIWELLRRLKPMSEAPWMLIGDFNEAMWSFEQFSSRRRPKRQMSDFRDVLADCEVFDLRFSGVPWTFDNKQAGNKNVKVRLDRVVASSGWTSSFPKAKVHHLITLRLDHLPVLLDVEPDQTKVPSGGGRYEIMWEREPSLPKEIKLAWAAGNPVHHLGDVAKNLTGVMQSLKRWSKQKFGAVTKELEKLRKRLEELTVNPQSANDDEINNTRIRMDEVLYREEMMWLQ
jgi:hypothetical protein